MVAPPPYGKPLLARLMALEIERRSLLLLGGSLDIVKLLIV